MRLFKLAVLLTVLSCLAGTLVYAAGVDYAAARKLSDSFMQAWNDNKVDEAVNLMEPQYIRTVGRAAAAARMRKFFDYCGRPLDSEFKQAETGFKDYPDGRKLPTRKFYYTATTDKLLKGACWFTIVVVPNAAGPRVSEYGAIRIDAGDYI